jgi:putative oxidoreductase
MPMFYEADSALSSAGLLAGRLLLALIFVHEGWSLIGSYGPAVAYLQKFGISATLLPAVILLQLSSGLLVVAGLLTRVAALALAAFCVFTALFFHRQLADANQLLHLQKDLAIAGGFLTLAVAGPGGWSVGRYLTVPPYAR